ncbi:MAG: PHP domain-containing protein [Anaerolineae bacterium]|nr:PHP domain-containing protein [Anaerolineae bacterium]
MNNRSDQIATSAWGRADLHIHTRFSDGGPSPEQVVHRVLRRGHLDVIAITDHNRIEGALRAREAARGSWLQVIVGEEVSTADGHLLALFIQERILPGLPVAETIAEVHAQGGLAIAAHPFDPISHSLLGRGSRVRSVDELARLPLDGMETLNASLARQVGNALSEVVAQRLGLTGVGGSDAHHLAVIGQAYTLFPGRTAEDLRRAIIAGTATAAGRRWRWSQYLSWIYGCLIPRTARRVYQAARTARLA